MANRYWVGGSGDWWNLYATEHWSLTSGGASGASAPGSGDTAHFDANSFSGDGQRVTIYDSINCHIDTAGMRELIELWVYGGQAILQLQEALSGFDSIKVFGGGSLITNNHNVTVAGGFSIENSDLGTSVITITKGGVDCPDFTPPISIGAALVLGSSVICADATFVCQVRGSVGSFFQFDGNGYTIKAIAFTFAEDAIYSGMAIGNCTVGDLAIYGDGAAGSNNVGYGLIIVTNSITMEGNTPGGLHLVNQDFSMESGIVNVANCTISNSSASGGASFKSLSGNGNVDGGGNSGWNFGLYSYPPAGNLILQSLDPGIKALLDIVSGRLVLQTFPPLGGVSCTYMPLADLFLQTFPPKTNINNRVKYKNTSGVVFRDRGSVNWIREFSSRAIDIPAGELILTGYGPTTIGGVIHSYIPAALLLLTPHPPQTGVSRVPVPAASLIMTPHAPNQIQIIPALIPAGNFILQSYPLSVIERVPIPPALLILTSYAPGVIQNIYALVPPGNIILTPFSPQIKIIQQIGIPAASLILQKYNPRYTWTPANYHFFTLQNIYLCILTGDADGLDDLIIPISSFQSTMRDGDPSYLACVIPNSVDWIASIADRTNGDIVIRKGYRFSDGTIQAEEICRVAYESLQIFRGARSDSAMISGHLTTTSSDPKSVTLSKASYYGLQADGKRTFRAEPDLFLRVGDTAVYGSESFVVGQISYIVDSRLAIMQVTEA